MYLNDVIFDVRTISLHVETLLKYINSYNTNGKLSRTAQAGRLYIIVVLLCVLLESKLRALCFIYLWQCFNIFIVGIY